MTGRFASGLRVTVAAMLVAVATPATGGGLILPHVWQEGSAPDQWARGFARCAEERTGLFVEVVSGGKFGQPEELAAAVAFGQIDLAIVPVRALDEFWPELAAIDAPGVLTDPRALTDRSSDPDVVATIDRSEGKDGMRLLGLGWRYAVLVGDQTISEDLDGLLIRVGSQRDAEMLGRLGAVPERLPLAEVLPAFQFGVLNGAIVDTGIARLMLRDGGVTRVVGAQDFAPFPVAYAMVMSAGLAQWGEDPTDRLRHECAGPVAEFNARALDDYLTFLDQAREFGAELFVPDDATRDFWLQASSDAMREAGVEERGGFLRLLSN